MSRFQAISLICLLGTLPFTLGQGCDLSMPLRGEDAGLTNVFILNVDMLTPPAVKQTNLYKPGFTFATDPSNPSAGESIGFT
ncbi:MAG: hypothetical protein JSV03_06110, partial [Planctomycetota bacterium]